MRLCHTCAHHTCSSSSWERSVSGLAPSMPTRLKSGLISSSSSLVVAKLESLSAPPSSWLTSSSASSARVATLRAEEQRREFGAAGLEGVPRDRAREVGRHA